MAPPPWHATPDGQWHAKRIRLARSLLLERYFPKLAVHNGRGCSIQPTESACPCCVLYTHSRAAKRPLAASLPATPALGYRRCLIVFTVFRMAANDPEMFSLRCMFSRFCTPSYTLLRKGLQQPNLRWSHSLSTRSPAVPARYLVHQSSDTSDSSRSTLPPKWIPTRHLSLWSNRARQPTTAESRHGLLIFHTPDY